MVVRKLFGWMARRPLPLALLCCASVAWLVPDASSDWMQNAWTQNALAQAAGDAAKGDAATSAAQAAADVDAVARSAGGSAVTKLLVVAALFAIPLTAGPWLARRFRLPSHGWKFIVALFAVLAGAVIVATGEIKKGPDLSGGITLIYELGDSQATARDEGQDVEEAEEGAPQSAADQALRSAASKDELVDKLIKALSKRVDPSGTKEVTIRRYGEGQIEIIIPHAGPQELEYIQRKISTAGALEFRITASRQFPVHRSKIEMAERLAPGENSVIVNGEEVARWVPYNVKEFGPPTEDSGYIVKRKNVDVPQALVLMDDGLNVTGEYLRSAAPGFGETGSPQVNFTFNAIGADLFAQLTGNHVPTNSGQQYNLGILLDGELQQAPGIKQRIRGQGEISGGMSEEDVNFVVEILNAGSLPASLNKSPIRREQISPTLGKETIEKGNFSIIAAMAAVALFMLVYYRVAGLVACIALALNLLLLLAVMIVIKGAFTLPGLAGLALTVGMSVDANVLIFERIREELRRGAKLRMAIKNGFERALSAIVDSNLTTLLTAVVIYKLAPDNIKGFGVTLFLGIVISLFTAIFLSRLILDAAERIGWIKSLSMAQFIGDTSFDFIRIQGKAITLSLVAIAIGMAALTFRGRDMLNIDFTGGSSVTMVLDQSHKKDYSEVKKILSDKTKLGDNNLTLIEMGGTNTRYTVTSVNQDVEEVQRELMEAFKGELQTYRVEVSNLKELPTALLVPPHDRQLATAPARRSDEANSRHFVALFQDENANAQGDSASGAGPESAGPEATGDPQAGSAAQNLPAPSASEVADPNDSSPADAPARPATDRFAGGVSALLRFDAPEEATAATGDQGASAEASAGVSYDMLDQLIRDALQSVGKGGAAYQILNSQYKPGTERRFAEWEVKLALGKDDAQKAFGAMQADMSAKPIFPLANKIGGRVAGRMTGDAIAATVFCLLGIMAYMWFRFHKVIYGVAAVSALIHDVLITLGAVALSSYIANGAPPLAKLFMVDKFQLSLTLVAALLTIVGYSINDTIVIFDRIREIKGKSPKLTADMINQAVNQTLGRTILTTFTTLLTVLILYIWGGDGIHDFAYALIFGLLAGTYSTVYIASPVLLWLSRRSDAAAGAQGARAA